MLVHGAVPIAPEWRLHPLALRLPMEWLAAVQSDYIALGGFHEFRAPNDFDVAGRIPACYPGSFASLDSTELAPRGVVIAEIEAGRPPRLERRESAVAGVRDLGRLDIGRYADEQAVADGVLQRLPAGALPVVTLAGEPSFALDAATVVSGARAVGRPGIRRRRDVDGRCRPPRRPRQSRHRGRTCRAARTSPDCRRKGHRRADGRGARAAYIASRTGGRLMRSARLTSIGLAYGCHHARFDLPLRRVPIVIYGSNGSGKTTLVEALVTTTYGFDVRTDAGRLRERMPWVGDHYAARLNFVLVDPLEQLAFSIERDFLSQQVVVTRAHDGAEVFRGDADPGSSTQDAQRYRHWVGEHFGLDTRWAYELTACINQGALTQTRVGEHLLRIAAGGFTLVSSAKADIERRYYALTREPIGHTAARRTIDGALDTAEQEVLALEHRLDHVRARLERRHAALRERDVILRELAHLDRDIALLESALPLLADRQALRQRRDRTAKRATWLETHHRELNNGVLRLQSAEHAWDVVRAGAVYPEDFPERAAVLGELWAQKTAVDQDLQEKQSIVDRSARAPGWVSGLLGTIGFVALAGGAWLIAGLGRPVEGAVAIGLGMTGLIGLWLWRRAEGARWHQALAALEEVAQRQRELGARIANKSRDLPESETLNAETLPDRRMRFETQQRARTARDETRRRLNDVLARTVEDLSVARGPEGPAPSGVPAPVTPMALLDAMLSGIGGSEADASSSASPPAASRLLKELEESASAERLALTERDLELRRTLERPLQLPSDVTADAVQVESALADRRTRRDAPQSRLRALDAELADHARADESIVGIDTALQRARRRWETLAQSADVYRHAYALLGDAYEEFHRADEQRLLTAISTQLRALSDGVLGPFVATHGLDDVRVMLAGRAVPLESPPLSYGEYHAVLLAARFGTADFLARVGVRPPVIIDEPFTHLDEHRAARVWELLNAVARDRQVIVATQDRLILEILGIVPDIELAVRTDRKAAEEAAASQSSEPVLPAILDALREELTRWEGGQ